MDTSQRGPELSSVGAAPPGHVFLTTVAEERRAALDADPGDVRGFAVPLSAGAAMSPLIAALSAARDDELDGASGTEAPPLVIAVPNGSLHTVGAVAWYIAHFGAQALPSDAAAHQDSTRWAKVVSVSGIPGTSGGAAWSTIKMCAPLGFIRYPAAEWLPRPHTKASVAAEDLTAFEHAFAAAVLPPLRETKANDEPVSMHTVVVAADVMKSAAFLQVLPLQLLAGLSLRFHSALADRLLSQPIRNGHSRYSSDDEDDDYAEESVDVGFSWQPKESSHRPPADSAPFGMPCPVIFTETSERDDLRTAVPHGAEPRVRSLAERQGYRVFLPKASVDITTAQHGDPKDVSAAMTRSRGSIHTMTWTRDVHGRAGLSALMNARRQVTRTQWRCEATLAFSRADVEQDKKHFNFANLLLEGVTIDWARCAVAPDGGVCTSISVESTTGLTELIDYGCEELPVRCFTECVCERIVPPTTLRSIAKNAFTSAHITTVDLRSCTVLESIDASAFSGFEGSVLLGPGVTDIGDQAFWCSAATLVDLSLCAELTVLPAKCFKSFRGDRILLPPRLEVVGPECFHEMSHLPSIVRQNCGDPAPSCDDAASVQGVATLVFPPTTRHLSHCVFGSTNWDIDLSRCLGLEMLPSVAFDGTSGALALPPSVKDVRMGCFGDRQSSLDLSHCIDLREIPARCFESFRGDALLLPTSIQQLDVLAFHGCRASVDLSQCAELTTIPDQCFSAFGVSTDGTADVESDIELEEEHAPESSDEMTDPAEEICDSSPSGKRSDCDVPRLRLPSSVTTVLPLAFERSGADIDLSHCGALASVAESAFRLHSGALTLPRDFKRPRKVAPARSKR